MNNLAKNIFKYRSYTPIPFVVLMLIFQKTFPASLIVGGGILLLGEFFRLWGVCYAGSETRTTGDVGGTFLVVSGAYSYVRNPLYFGNMLMYLGIGLMSMSLFPYLQIAALLFFYFQYQVIITEEEKYLISKFGQHFDDYKKSVPKLIPSFSKYINPEIVQPPFNLKAGLCSENRTLQAMVFIILLIIIRYVLS